MAGFDVTALAQFNNELAGEFLVKSVIAGSTAEYVTVKEGIKYKEPLNLQEIDLVIQDGQGCVTTPSGSVTYTQRDIQVCQRSSFDGLCLRDLDSKYIGLLGPAGSYPETYAFVEEYASQLVANFQKKNDEFIWTATTAAGDCVDGLNTLLASGSAAGSPTFVSSSVATSTDIGNQIDAQLEALDVNVQDRDDLTVFMSIANFRKYIVWLRNTNNYYFDMNSVENRGSLMSMKHPFANLTIVGTVGLAGSNRIVMGPARQIVIGTDLISDLDNFQLWYDINGDQLKHRIVTKLGVQVAYPEFWVTNNL
tara:strand:+ start:2826 stop:3749 length:924 start_codon:yes stop_codon:yes gene_type:complete